MKRTGLLFLILLLTPLVLCDDGGSGGGGGGGGDGGGGDGGDFRNDANRESDDRKVEVNINADEIEIETQSRVNGQNDHFRFRMKLNDDGGLSATIQSEAQDPGFQDRQTLSVYFSQIISYSGGGFYTGGANTVGNGYSLANRQWKPFACNNGTPKWICVGTTADNVFAATFEFAGTSFTASNLTVTPSDLKITVTVNYPYAPNASSTDRVAVQVFGRAKAVYITPDADVQKYKLVNTGISAFTWITNAAADGVNVAVGSSPVVFSDDGDQKRFGLWFSFDANKPTTIVWDPTVSTNNFNASPALIINAVLLVLALFML